MRANFCGRIASILSAALLAAAAQSADAGFVTLGVTNITNNSASIASQLKIVVADHLQSINLSTVFPLSVYDNNPIGSDVIAAPTAGQVNFIFVNLGSAASSITDVYFDDGTLLGIASLTESSGVDYSTGASPGNLPGGNALAPDFETTAGFSADSDAPTQPNGVNPGEWLAVTFNLINGKTYADVVSALNLAGANGGLRIGMHVQGLSDGESDSYVNNPPGGGGGFEIPEPASIVLLGSGMLGAMVVARRRRQSA